MTIAATDLSGARGGPFEDEAVGVRRAVVGLAEISIPFALRRSASQRGCSPEPTAPTIVEWIADAANGNPAPGAAR